jgi:prevent-host-death family protein
MKTAIKNLSVLEVRKRLGEFLNEIRYTGNIYIIERKGQKLAAIVPMTDFELLQKLKKEQ